MPNSRSKKVYVQGFECESINFRKPINMFESMDIDEYIYGGVVETSYKKYVREDAIRSGQSSKNRGEISLSHT